ncbi:high mobility group protein B3 [Fistulifera solaris]|uniref:High mobility group protein B3 n=1 Tax=Fistulifera solaris TaxID=1519565 RepID=A0A1Z5KQT2_FISSO|nr:high mobility group protein B3 [Fistulifera solaris]|eukprot:GAX28452.1 high mobility group protein B3 [Fistulifera solaris]
MAPIDYEEDIEDEEEDEEEEEAPRSRKRSSKKWKDPSKPKRAMSAFFIFSQANRQRIKEENPEASFGDLARILAREYKELPEKEMRKWEKKAEQDKFRYQEEMKDYVPLEDPTGGGGKKKAKKDPSAPKRNMSAYFLFSIDERPRVKEENPDASFGDIARMISERFKTLSASEKKIWETKAAEDKERYAREMAEYQG